MVVSLCSVVVAMMVGGAIRIVAATSECFFCVMSIRRYTVGGDDAMTQYYCRRCALCHIVDTVPLLDVAWIL